MLTAILSFSLAFGLSAQQRARELGIRPGIYPPGALNAITDVEGVRVGQVTLKEGDSIRTGVTAILPHGGNLFQQKVPASVFIANAFGKLAGSTQVEELGNIETPIILTNTLSVAEGIAGAVEHTLHQPGNEQVFSVNAVVGETNDRPLNDIRRRYVTKEHVRDAIRRAAGGPVEEGDVGAGTGTVCFGFKGGMGTSSRVLPAPLGGYTVGVLVQTNYGGHLHILGAPVGRELARNVKAAGGADGSCMIVVATNAPLDARNLKRLGSRAILGLGVTGSSTSNGSGEYVIAFSTAVANRVPMSATNRVLAAELLTNDAISPLFQAVKEATEEAVYNSMFMARTSKGHQGRIVEALPSARVVEILKKHGLLEGI